MPSGTVEIDAPQALKESSHPSVRHEFAIVPQRVTIEGKDEDRSLHAKSIWLERDSRALCMVGSSNFTAAGLPPSSLKVRWHDEERGEQTTPWVVNVANMSALPPPDELGSLSLAELIEILTSARPLHESKEAPANMIEVDPHRKVDTSQFLLRRMRRVAQALEGMRERLQRPMAPIDALRWRLQGPIGPVALAKRLANDDPDGAAFMIAEVATTLRAVAWKPHPPLHSSDIAPELKDTLRALHQLALQAPAPTSLAAYVKTSFEEILA